jgi:hypothetical protein
MNQQNTTPPPPEITPEDPIAADKKAFGDLVANIPQILKGAGDKLLANKKLIIFISAGIIGLYVLVLVMGQVFKVKNSLTNPTASPSPTPETQNIQETPVPGDPLGENEIKLQELKNKIDSLDLWQNRLQPPVVNFKISF